MKRFLIPLFALVFILALPILSFADGPTATVVVPEGAWTVGDPIPLSVEVTHLAGYQVIKPEMETAWGDFLVHSTTDAGTVANADGTETTSFHVDARLFSPGQFETLPLTLTLTDGAGNLLETMAPPATVEIASILVEGDTQLRDIKPQADMPLAAIWPYLLGGFLALAAVIAGIVWWLRKRKAAEADNRLPHEKALDELKRIEGLGLPQLGQFKEHYTLISDCIRLYVEHTYDIPVLERTTGEIQTSFKNKNVGANSEVVRQFIRFLNDSDIVKFSKFTPDAVSAQHLLAQARWIVGATEHLHQPVEEEEESTPTKSSGSAPRLRSTKPAEVAA